MKIKQRDDNFIFECPGCECSHMINKSWGWNGSFDSPTFSPSILVKGSEFTEKGWEQYYEYMRGGKCPESIDSKDVICHSFINNGKIQFLGDCSHNLAGQIVELLDIKQ